MSVKLQVGGMELLATWARVMDVNFIASVIVLVSRYNSSIFSYFISYLQVKHNLNWKFETLASSYILSRSLFSLKFSALFIGKIYVPVFLVVWFCAQGTCQRLETLLFYLKKHYD